MPRYEFARVRLEAAQAGRGKSLLTIYLSKPGSPETMPGGASVTNIYSHLARMGLEGWQLVDTARVSNGESGLDHIFWLQRELP